MNGNLTYTLKQSALVTITFIILSTTKSLGANSALDHYDQPWEICALCHSLDGNSHMAKFPKLAGQPSNYLQKQLHDFLQGKRSNDGGQMSAIVTEINVDDISRIADWFASQPTPPPIESDTDLSIGRDLYNELNCASCHSSDATENASTYVPYLTSQHAGYLVKQLRDFQQGNRSHVTLQATDNPLAALTDTDINALATYLAATPRE